jgi:TonB family protein
LLFVVGLCCVEATGQQRRTYPPFTSVTRVTEYDGKGETVHVSTFTRYQSSNGDWRVVSKSGGDEYATLYRSGQGVYQSNSRTLRIIKDSNHAPGCPQRTGEELRKDPKFNRTEELLGLTAYVLLDDRPAQDLQIEHYFVPELGGGTPVKQVTAYKNGPKVVSEPLGITVGEPAAIDVTGPAYLVIEQTPVFVQNLGGQLLSQPDPDYPPEALAQRLSGVVRVTVTIDDTGQVIMAGALRGAPQLLRQAAVEAAYKASFKPVIADGIAVVGKGIIDYSFVLAKVNSHRL